MKHRVYVCVMSVGVSVTGQEPVLKMSLYRRDVFISLNFSICFDGNVIILLKVFNCYVKVHVCSFESSNSLFILNT